MAVREHHRIAKRYGTVGEVVGRYGGEEYLAVDVRFSDGGQRLFSPGDLEEVRSSSQPSWWRSVLGESWYLPRYRIHRNWWRGVLGGPPPV
jgi:hypothetical protein